MPFMPASPGASRLSITLSAPRSCGFCGAMNGASRASATMMPSRIAAPRVVGLLRRRWRTVARSVRVGEAGTGALMPISS